MNNLVCLKNSDYNDIVYNINNFNNPEYIYVPINYINEDIKINDYIYKNTFFKNYIVSISGTICGVVKKQVNKKVMKVLIIANDYKENALKKGKKKIIKTREDLLNLINDNKLEDLFNRINNINRVDNLVISSIDEEIYTVKEYIRLANNYREILETIDLLSKVFNLDNSMLVTKNTNFKSIKNVKSIIGTYPNIKTILIPDKYLIGRKEFLCKYLNLEKNYTLMLSTNELYELYLLMKGINLNEILITISGNAINKGIVVNTKIGVGLKEIINEYVEIIDDEYDIYINGLLRGYKLDKNSDLVITKDIEYIVINKKIVNEETDCINCGACKKICPFDINVLKCFNQKLTNKKCIGCGLCNYICPANIDLKKIVGSINEENSK